MITKENLTQIVAPGQVSQKNTDLEAYARDISFVNTIKPRYVVKPKTSQAIQQLVKLANETLTPLVPVSSGPPHFRGDTVPGTGGAVVVDLSGMKRIIFVDRPRRVALCYMAPSLRPAPPDPAYVRRILEPARQCGFPDWYLKRIESFLG